MRIRVSDDRKAQKGTEVDHWRPPPQGSVKINSDASFHAETREASAGVIVRGENGQVLLTACQLLKKCSSTKEVEAEACLEGLRLTTEWVQQLVILEAGELRSG
jgi:ribonuclease HI